MEVRYTLEGRDNWHFTKYLLSHAPETWANWLFRTALLPAAAVILTCEWLKQPEQRLLVAGGFSLLWIVYRIVNARRISYNKIDREPEEERRISIAISGSGIGLKTKDVDSTFTWPNIAQIAGDSEYIYLFFNRAQAMIVPKRVFANPEEAAAFYSAAKQFKASENPQTPAPALPAAQATADAVSIDFDLTLDDYCRFVKTYDPRAKQVRTGIVWLLGTVTILIGGGFITSYFLLSDSSGRAPVSILFVSALCFVVGIGGFWRRSWWRYRLVARKLGQANPGTLGRHKITLQPDGVKEISAFGETSIGWGTVLKVEDNERFLYLFLNPATAYIIPKAAFATEVASITFLHTAREYLSRVQSGVYDNAGANKASWPPAPSAKREAAKPQS